MRIKLIQDNDYLHKGFWSCFWKISEKSGPHAFATLANKSVMTSNNILLLSHPSKPSSPSMVSNVWHNACAFGNS